MSARAVLIRGLFSASGASAVAFTSAGVDTFEGRFDELHPEAREGRERIARLIESTPPHLLVPRDPPSTPPKGGEPS